MVSKTPDNLVGLRNRALLLVGVAAALRGQEMANLKAEDVWHQGQGMQLRIPYPRSRQGHSLISIPRSGGLFCPVTALETWLSQAQISSGPVFRPIAKHGAVGNSGLSVFSISQIVKACAEAAGLNSEGYSSHSLRAGRAKRFAMEAGAVMRNRSIQIDGYNAEPDGSVDNLSWSDLWSNSSTPEK